jgi:hypothetical protein
LQYHSLLCVQHVITVCACRQVAGSFGIVFAIDWPQVMMDVWLFVSTVVQIDFIRFPVSL